MPLLSSDSCQENAGLMRRLASMVYELFLVVGILAIAVMLPNVLLGAILGILLPGSVLILNIAMALGCYFIWHWLRNGQTLAMRTWKIYLVDAASGAGLRPAQALLRYLTAWFSMGLCGVGIVWALIDRDRQFLHDRIAESKIICVIPTTSLHLPPAGK